ncbi:hypothetical protein N9A64_04425 [Pseudomonadales bacterium]|nr:hypothetical protein [Pseudomonadales bacterium]
MTVITYRVNIPRSRPKGDEGKAAASQNADKGGAWLMLRQLALSREDFWLLLTI